MKETKNDLEKSDMPDSKFEMNEEHRMSWEN
jgi:hypothetical protein